MVGTSFSSRRLVSVLLAVLLVTSGIAGFAAPAAASHECDLSDKTLALAFSGPSLLAEATGGSALGCDILHDEVVDQDQTDAEQLKIDLYAAGQSQKAQREVYDTSLNNYLNDSRTTALLIGKNAYIRSLENGSTKAEAINRSQNAVSDYYSIKQINLIEGHNATVSQFLYQRSTYDNESGVTRGEMYTKHLDGRSWPPYAEIALGTSGSQKLPLESVSGSVTLVNGSSRTSAGIKEAEGIAPMLVNDRDIKDGGGFQLANIYIEPPNDNYEPLLFWEFNTSYQHWNEIQSQNSEVTSQLETFVNDTYDGYQQGTINTSDLVDPYLASRNYSPSDDYQTWALASLQSLGHTGPVNMSEVGHMAVYDNTTGETHNGILMSDGLPEGDAFEVGTTYNASNISGPQMVITNSERVDLSGEFVIEEAVTADGETQQTVEYRNITYETASIGEYQDLMTELAETRAEIEARENQLDGGGGGGGLLGDTSTVVIVAVAAAAALLLLRD